MFKPSQLLQALILNMASLLISIKQGLATNPVAQAHLWWLCNHPDPSVPTVNPWTLAKDGEFLLYKGALYVPDHQAICLDILRSHHDHRLAGHPSIAKTISSI